MTPEHYSLKKRLLLWISVPVLVASILILVMAFFFTTHEVDEVYDAQLVHTAKTLLQLTQSDIDEDNAAEKPLEEENFNLSHHYENKSAFRIWVNGKIFLQSARAKDFNVIDSPIGFSNQKINGKPWRLFIYADDARHLKVEVGERAAIRYELVGQLMASLAIPMGILIPSLLVIVWVGVRISLRPLVSLSSDVDMRRVDDLSPIHDCQEIPLEVTPLIEALNRLFKRIHDSFQREREFTDHAAHELRTPLAAMKTQTQVLMRKASAMPECQDGLENLHATIDRTSHLIEQLLSLARLQNETLPLSSVNLSECVNDAVNDAVRLAAQKNQEIRAEIADAVKIKGHSDSLYILIRNLLDNAIKYTPENGIIEVRLDRDGTLSVRDNGPGIADADKKRVFTRFVRADKTGQIGSGLGLSIVQWVAQAHNADIRLSDNMPSGLVVTLKFN